MSQHRLTADIRCVAPQLGLRRIRLRRTSAIRGVLAEMALFCIWEVVRLLVISDEIKKIYPEALLGLLAMKNVCNPNQHEELNQGKLELENNLRKNFAQLERSDLKNMEPLKTYNNYYKRFKKTYQVLLQLESIVFKNKSIPRVASLVEVMFMAELKNLLLTAGHDLETIDRPLRLDVSSGKEKYTLLNGQEEELLSGDMMISDLKGIISSIIYGPDQRTRIKPNTPLDY